MEDKQGKADSHSQVKKILLVRRAEILAKLQELQDKIPSKQINKKWMVSIQKTTKEDETTKNPERKVKDRNSTLRITNPLSHIYL